MNTKAIYIDSNPTNVVTADIGTFFIREGNIFYVRDPQGRVTKLPQQYRPKDFNRVGYKQSLNIYNTPYEIWEKVSGNGTKTGWKFVAYRKYFTDAIQATPSTPSPTPTPTPLPVAGWVDVTQPEFKDYVTAQGIGDFYITGIGSSASATSHFVWDSTERHFRLDDMAGEIVTSDLLNLTPALTTLIGNIYNVRFQLSGGSSSTYFYAAGSPFLSSISETNATLAEEYSGGPQYVTVQDMYTYSFVVKANVTVVIPG